MNDQSLESSRIAQTFSPWDANENIIWLASVLSFHRNIDKFKFPQKLEKERKSQLLSLMVKAILANPDLKNPFTIAGERISPLERNFLLEHFLIFEGLLEERQGEAFVLDDTGQFIALLNLKDHLSLQYTDISGDLEKSWLNLVKLENSLANSFTFAFLPKFGFLTADPAHCGTGLVVTAYLHLPALIHLKELSEFQEKERSDAILSCGLQGDPEDLIGDILTIRNNYSVGVSEETIISTLRNAILKLVIAEKDARSKIKNEGHTGVKDKISRAIGILKYSYQLETVEALSEISLLKLGIELGWVKGMSVREVNRIFFTCRRAHLKYSLKEQIPNDGIAIKRADVLREKVKNITCDFE